MLTIPWFVTRTVQDLFRWHPQPPPQPQEEPPTSPSQQQKLQQQQQQARLQQQRFQQQQQKPQQGGLQQRQQQQQQVQVQQTSARPGLQSKVPAPTTKTSPATATSSPVPQTQARPAPVQNTASTPLQVKPAQKQPNQQNSHEPSVKTSTKTLVLTPSASGGKMSEQWAQQQVEKFTFDFDKADKDKSGSLSFNEVYDVLKTVGFKGSEKEAQFIFGHLDKDKNQTVSREEFAAALKNLPRLSIKEFSLRKAFLKMDKDGSGYLTRTEIEDATKTDAGLDIAAEKIADLLVYLCKEDKDKKVSYEEFLRVFGIEATATVMRKVFSALDADGSGFLTRDEVLQAVKTEFELKLQADKIADLVIFLVTDQDKKISYEEFITVWLKQKEEKKK